MTDNEADVLSVEQDMEKTIKVFCWDAVNPIVARAFLRAAYLAERQSDQATGVAKLDDAQISVICDDLFGRPPKKKFFLNPKDELDPFNGPDYGKFVIPEILKAWHRVADRDMIDV